MTSSWTPVEPTTWADPSAPWAATGSALGAAAPPRRRGAWVLAVLGVVLAAALAVGLLGPRVVSTGVGYRMVAGIGAPASGPEATPGANGAAPSDRDSLIATLLARRGDAVTGDDPAAYAATQTAHAMTPAFARLAPLPLTLWSYRILTTSEGTNDATVLLDVRLHLRLDADTSDAVVHEHLTLQRGAAGWRVAAEVTADRRAQPWDLGAITVVHGSRSLVIGIDEPASVLWGYARLADAAVPGVSAVWGTGWTQRPVLVIPRTTVQLGRALARSAESLDGYAAVTTGELSDAGGTNSALRVWTNTPGMNSLSTLGRQVVVKHELTHVATDAPGTPGVPLWLEEGFAEYVGYQGSGVRLSDELRELLAAERAGDAPQGLPSQATFDGAQVDLAYEAGDLACRVAADRYGQQGLVRLYRLTAAGTGSGGDNLEAALRAVTGSGTASFTLSFRTRLRALAG